MRELLMFGINKICGKDWKCYLVNLCKSTPEQLLDLLIQMNHSNRWNVPLKSMTVPTFARRTKNQILIPTIALPGKPTINSLRRTFVAFILAIQSQQQRLGRSFTFCDNLKTISSKLRFAPGINRDPGFHWYSIDYTNGMQLKYDYDVDSLWSSKEVGGLITSEFLVLMMLIPDFAKTFNKLGICAINLSGYQFMMDNK